MKLLQRNVLKDGSGSMKLLPQEEEDMWHLYNLIAVNDSVTATSFRKVNTTSSTGSSTSQKVKLTLTIGVEEISFDAATCELRLKGKNRTENEFLKLGQYHTVELTLQHSFSLEKPHWDSIFLDRVEIATDVKHSAEVAALVLQPGLAHLCLLTTHMTVTKQKIEMSIARKRAGGGSGHDNSIKKFFLAMVESIKKHVNFNVVKCVIVASPGFLKDDFLKFLFEESVRIGWKELIENRNKFLACHSSSGFKHAIKEILADPAVVQRMDQTKAASEVKSLDQFFEMLNSDPERAYYGFNHVVKANEAKAVEILLLTDELFRSSDVKTRAEYVRLKESVEENNGDVRIFSSQHVSGEQLNQLSGVAAILRFPLPESEIEDGTEQQPEEEPEEYEEKRDGNRGKTTHVNENANANANTNSAADQRKFSTPSSAAVSSAVAASTPKGGKIVEAIKIQSNSDEEEY